MGYAAAEQAIREHFVDEWPDLTTISYTFDNAGDNNDFPTRGSAWVRVSIVQGEARQVEHGITRRFRRAGVVVVQIFTPAGSGTGDALTLADYVRDVFEGRTINGVLFRATSVDRVGIDGPWYQINARTPFQADELR